MEKLKPAVSKHWLFIIAGIMWSAVGLMLIWRAVGWYSAIEGDWAIVMVLLGVALALAVYYFMFSKIARKNLKRLCQHPDKVCLFAFQSWQGYLIIVFMVSLGIGLRNSPFPKPWLAVIYTGIGGGLFIASLHFYERIRQMVYLQQPCLQEEGEA
jgi:drug/metabolite transporter (DMT)-like permease